MRERILSSVLLPAPFGPMMPTTSPTPTLKLTSLSAQNSVVSAVSWPARRRSRRSGPPSIETMDSRKFVASSVRPMAYRLATPAIVMASDDIGKPAFDDHEVAQRHHEHDRCAREGFENEIARQRPSEHGVSKARDHPDHRI